MKAIYFFIILSITVSCSEKQNTENIDMYKKTTLQLKNELSILTENELISQEIFRRTIKYLDKSINNGLVYWGKDSLNTFSLDTIASKPRLAFCFSTNVCSPCVDKAIELMQKVFDNYSENELIIITGDYPLRLRDNCYGKRMLTGINLPIEEIEAPFFFILDKKLNLSSLHIFNKANPDRTEIYLEEIKSKHNI